MKFKLFLICLTGTFILNIIRAKAQDSTTGISSTHLQAAENYLIATDVDTKLGELITTMVKTFSARMPEENRHAFTGVMNTFMHKYFTWERLKAPYSKLYATEFSEDELNQLAAFFKTPIGKKYTAKSVELLQQSMQIGQQVVIDHKDELEQMLREAVPGPEIKDPGKQ